MALLKRPSFGNFWDSLIQASGLQGRWVWDLKNNTCKLDPAFINMTGLTSTEGQISPKDVLSKIHKSDRKLVAKEVMTAFETGKGYDVSFRFVRAEGDIIIIKALGHIVKNKKTGGAYLLGMNFDVTPQVSVEVESDFAMYECYNRSLRILRQLRRATYSHEENAELMDVNVKALAESLAALENLSGTLLHLSGHKEDEQIAA